MHACPAGSPAPPCLTESRDHMTSPAQADTAESQKTISGSSPGKDLAAIEAIKSPHSSSTTSPPTPPRFVLGGTLIAGWRAKWVRLVGRKRFRILRVGPPKWGRL